MCEYKRTEASTVGDYFDRFYWALKLSRIPEEDYHDYARVHMDGELNTKRSTRTNRYDGRKEVRQDVGESLAKFSLRLKQAVRRVIAEPSGIGC